jgi:uncharacterized protein
MTGMDAAYFDSSVLLKRYVRENGSDSALALTRRHLIVSAAIAPLEMRSALRRITAEGSLTAKALKAALRRIQSERDRWDLVVISDEVLQTAERLTVDLNVRSLDSIHLACALLCHSQIKRRLQFITADIRQKEAGRKLGLDVVSVE